MLEAAETPVEKEHDLHRREARKTGGGIAPASPREVSKLVADVLPASVNPLEQLEFELNFAGEELDSRRDKDEREVITCEVEPSLFADLEAIGKKGAEKVTKKEGNQKYSNSKLFLMIIYYIIDSY